LDFLESAEWAEEVHVLRLVKVKLRSTEGCEQLSGAFPNVCTLALESSRDADLRALLQCMEFLEEVYCRQVVYAADVEGSAFSLGDAYVLCVDALQEGRRLLVRVDVDHEPVDDGMHATEDSTESGRHFDVRSMIRACRLVWQAALEKWQKYLLCQCQLEVRICLNDQCIMCDLARTIADDLVEFDP
jgi:hypothetical protein